MSEDSDSSGDEEHYMRETDGEDMGCCNCTAEEVDPDNFGLGHKNPNLFVRSQWAVSQTCYAIYRLVVGLLFIVWVAMDIWTETSEFYEGDVMVWFVYATNWSFLLLGVSTMYNAVIVIYYCVRARKEGRDGAGLDEMPVVLMVHWMLYNIVTNAALVVSISFWTYLTAMESNEFLQTPMSRVKHSLNTVYVIADLMIQAVPVRLFHVVYPLFLGSVYIVFNALYFLNNGTGFGGAHYAYDTMDWNKPFLAATTCAMGLIGSTLSQCILFLLYSLRRWIYKKTNPSGGDDLLQEGCSSEREHILGVTGGSYRGLDNIEMATASQDSNEKHDNTETVFHEHENKGTHIKRDLPGRNTAK